MAGDIGVLLATVALVGVYLCLLVRDFLWVLARDGGGSR